MSEEKKPRCFGCMDCYTTGDCSKCEYQKDCWELTFGDLQDDLEA